MKTFQFKEAQRFSECKIFNDFELLENEDKVNALSELEPALEKFISDKNDLASDANKLGFSRYQNNLMPGNFVGLTWLKEKELAIQVTPKFQDLDYLSMYLKCMEDSTAAEHLGNVFFCWPEQEPIEVKEAKDFLWFIIGMFLQSTHKLCLRHLRKNFIRTEENLIGKTKGRILLSSHIRENLVKARPDRIYSQFQIISDNCRENQILVAALEKCVQYLARNSNFNKGSYSKLWDWSRVIRASLSNVDLKQITNRDFLNIRYTGIYSNYKEPHQYAKMILNMLGADPAIQLEDDKRVKIHPFAICMYELFERYCEVLLREQYSDLWAGYGLGEGNDLGDKGELARPDFLLTQEKYILDAKYKGHSSNSGYNFSNEKDDLKQMAWYSRHKDVLYELQLQSEYDSPNKMFILYPKLIDGENFSIDLEDIKDTSKSISFLHKIEVPIPKKK